MDKIEVGEYVRTIDGNIARLIKREIKDEDVKDGMLFDNYICENHTYIRECCLKEKIKTHSKNKIELLKDGDFVELEYKSSKYRKRITRVFEVSELDEYIIFENYHCNFFCKKGDKKITDKTCKNIKIKSIVTHEQFESMKYNFEEEE